MTFTLLLIHKSLLTSEVLSLQGVWSFTQEKYQLKV